VLRRKVQARKQTIQLVCLMAHQNVQNKENI
jgi:hypothetical protein